MKWVPDSPATACAIRVLPVPEGPWRSTPRGGGIPGRIKVKKLLINWFGIKEKIPIKGDFVMVDGMRILVAGQVIEPGCSNQTPYHI